MKFRLFLLLLSFSALASAQTDSVPARLTFASFTLELGGSNVSEKFPPGSYDFLRLNFGYILRTKTRVSVAELNKAIPTIARALRPAVRQWKALNQEAVNAKYDWKYYTLSIGIYNWNETGNHLFTYIIDHRNDSLEDMERSFSMADSVTDMQYIYSPAYLDRVTGYTMAKRIKIYEQLAGKIHECASERVAPLLAAYDEKVTQGDIDTHNRLGRRIYYLDCFRGLIKKYIKTTDPQVLKALYAELCCKLGHEEEWGSYGVTY